MEYLVLSRTEPVDTRNIGPVTYWDIVVKDLPVLKDAAFMYTDPPEGELSKLKGMVMFRVFEHGDPANPHCDLNRTGEKDGVTIHEDWFG